jgi:peptidoglycan/xylan/chitin deacetylase (PgdA/CDA1 family)
VRFCLVSATFLLLASSTLADPVMPRKILAAGAAKPARTQPPTYMPERYRSTEMLKAREDYDKAHGFHFDKMIRGNAAQSRIALTFDDGPHPERTLQLLAVLKEMRVPATFFVVGRQVEKYPELLRREVADGHEIGNHTYDHIDLTEIPPELVGYELEECDRAIKQAAGVSVHCFRPPGGNYDNDVIREAVNRKYLTTLWTDDPADYDRISGDVILHRCLDHLENGAIILLHDGVPEMLDILPSLITQARRRGFEFVRISDLARPRREVRQKDREPRINKSHEGHRGQSGL